MHVWRPAAYACLAVVWERSRPNRAFHCQRLLPCYGTIRLYSITSIVPGLEIKWRDSIERCSLLQGGSITYDFINIAWTSMGDLSLVSKPDVILGQSQAQWAFGATDTHWFQLHKPQTFCIMCLRKHRRREAGLVGLVVSTGQVFAASHY